MAEVTKGHLLHLIKQRTGKNIVEDYGFELGTQAPFIGEGMLSSVNQAGYTIWKRNPDNTITRKSFENRLDGSHIEDILNFLK